MKGKIWLSDYVAEKDLRDVKFMMEKKLIDSIDAEGILRKNKVLEVFDGFEVFSKDGIKQFQKDSDTQFDLEEIGSELESDDVTVEEVWLMKRFESKLSNYNLEGQYYRLGSALLYGTGRKDYFVWINEEDDSNIKVKQRTIPLELRLALEHLILATVCLSIFPVEFYKFTAVIHVPLVLYNSVKKVYYKSSFYFFLYAVSAMIISSLVGLTCKLYG